MAEYIEREALLELISDQNRNTCNGKMSCLQMRRMVDGLHAADVVEVMHGRWEEAGDGDGVVCSVCREDFCNIYLEVDRFKYCPNCGARMDGE